VNPGEREQKSGNGGKPLGLHDPSKTRPRQGDAKKAMPGGNQNGRHRSKEKAGSVRKVQKKRGKRKEKQGAS